MLIQLHVDAGADCPWNATVDGLIVRPGYWRYSQETDALYKCVRSESAHSKAIVNVSSEASDKSSPCVGGVLGSQCTLDAALCPVPIARSK